MTTPIGSNSSLPTHDAAALGCVDDPLSAIYTAISTLRENDVALGQGRVAENDANATHAEALERAAIQQEKANTADSGSGFFGSIGNFVGDVASDLVHGRIGSAFDDAGRDLDSAWNSPKFWSDLQTGFEDVAVVAAAVAGTVLTAGVGGVAVGAGIAAAATTVGAAAGAGASLAHARMDHFAANVEDASADATADDGRIGELQQLTSDVLADLKQTDGARQRAIQTLTQAIQTHDQTAVAPASMTVKG